MNKIKMSGLVLAILFGLFMFVYGEYDDSPGGQLLGVALIVSGIIGLVRAKRKIRRQDE